MTRWLLQTRQTGVANEVFLKVWVDRALAAKPGESAFCFLTQVNLFKFWFSGRRCAFDFDFDQVGAGCADGGGLGVLAPGRDQLGLGKRVGGEDLQQGGEVLVGQLVGLATEQAANITTGEIGPPGDVALVEPAALGLALEGDGEVGHGGMEWWSGGMMGTGLVDKWIDGLVSCGRAIFLADGLHYVQHCEFGNERMGGMGRMALPLPPPAWREGEVSPRRCTQGGARSSLAQGYYHLAPTELQFAAARGGLPLTAELL